MESDHIGLLKIVMPGLVPGIHVFIRYGRKIVDRQWASKGPSPAMTK